MHGTDYLRLPAGSAEVIISVSICLPDVLTDAIIAQFYR